MASSRKRSPDVVDLLWDSSEDEARPVKKKEISKQSSTQETRTKSAEKKSRKSTLEVRAKKVGQVDGATSESSSTPPLKFHVATYNIWFGPPHPDERMMALAECLLAKNTEQTPLYFVGLQEVTPILWSTLGPILESAGYRLFLQDLAGGGYGCALAVLQTVNNGLKIIQHGWQPYRATIMNRGFLHVRAQLPNSTRQVLFTTTHLESFVGDMGGGGAPYTGAPEREQQVQELESFCKNHMKRYPDLSLAIISGDLNWDDERVQSKGTDKVLTDVLAGEEWKDTWFDVRDRQRRAVADRNGKVKKKDEPTCYTYDAKESAMLGGNLRRRFDRILLRQQHGVSMKVEDIELIGKEPILDGPRGQPLQWTKESNWNGRVTTKVVQVLPSDHFGYVATLNGIGFS